jgi:hypothetical protein
MKECLLLAFVVSICFGIKGLKDPSQTYAFKATQESIERLAQFQPTR